MRYDNIIIGGGLIGVTTAYELIRAGQSVLLLEALDELAAETSYANGGMLTASMPEPWNGPGVARHLFASLFDPHSAMKLRLSAIPGLTRWGIQFLLNSTPARHHHAIRSNYALARSSVEHTQQVIRELGIDCAAAGTGTLKTFDNKAAMAEPRKTAEALQDLGLASRICSTSEVIELEPQLEENSGNIAGGIFYPDDHSGDARRFTLELAQHCQTQGAVIKHGIPVKRIVRQGRRVTGVETSSRDFVADRVIVAAGNASPALVRPLGVYLPIKPAKGYSVTISANGWNAMPRIPVVDDALHAAVVPLGENLRVAGTAEFAGSSKVLSTERVDNLFNLLARIYPQLSKNVDRDKAKAWTGLRPMSADGLPFVGAVGPDGLWINSGHGHLGWTMAMGSARLIADQITGADIAIDPIPYRVER